MLALQPNLLLDSIGYHNEKGLIGAKTMKISNSQTKKTDSTGLAIQVNRVISDIINSPDINKLDEKQLSAIAKAVLVDELKDKLKKEVQKQKIKVGPLVKRWLSGFSSSHTKRSFQFNLNLFSNWLAERHFLDVDATIVDDYLIYLSNSKGINGYKISENTIRQRIAAPSSFYKSLVRWGQINHNPFNGAKLPKKSIQIKQSEKIPEDSDLDELEKIARNDIKTIGNHISEQRKRKSGTMALAALIVLRKTGLRVGALDTLRIDSKGYYNTKTKGSTATGRIPESTLIQLDNLGLDTKQPFKAYKSFSMWIFRASSGKFSAHSIRHRFALNFYNKTKDPAKLQKKLGHSSLNATTAYLAGLGIEN